MRFSDRITFVREVDAAYDPGKGEWTDGKISLDKQPCNLSPLSTERTNLLFGSIDKQIKVARLQRPYLKDFSHVLIEQERFEVQRQSNHKKGVLYLEALANG